MRHKIKGDLTSWNTSVWEFGQMMKSIEENEEIILEVNSYGGDVFIGIDICNTLRSHGGPVTVIITGIAASAASILAMGADTIKAYSNSQMMVHNAWTIVAGNAVELRKAAEDLESIGESVLASYTGRVDETQAKALLDAETFLSAAKAKEIGLIDEIIDSLDAEEVQSEIFREEIQEFNDLIKSVQLKNKDLKIAAALTDPAQLESLIRNMIKTYNQDPGEKPGGEPGGEPGGIPGGEPPKPKPNNILNQAFLNL